MIRRLVRALAGAGCALALSAVGGVMQPHASAQDSLLVDLVESPFLCDDGSRSLGVVSGLQPSEKVTFSSPQLNGIFSNRVADDDGAVDMRWSCDNPRTWTITIAGVSSGRSVTFTLEGVLAPPPADAPIGAAFDAKSAMTAADMAVWKDFSPFNTAGIYIDVDAGWDNRADKQQVNLTSSWVETVFADGWRLIPTYVGRQAPRACLKGSFVPMSGDSAVAKAQGVEAAVDAVAAMQDLGIGPANPIYYDMEAYGPGCSEAIIAFFDGWTEALHSAGYLSGIYGSRSSTMTDLTAAVGQQGFDPPDAVWVSTTSGQPTFAELEVPPDDLWPDARLNQYRLSITRTYGGVTREIDENVGNAPLAMAVSATPIVDNDGDGLAEPEPDNCDNIANPQQEDLDGDGDGDVCDVDIDGDGIVNEADGDPTDSSVGALPTSTAAPTAAATAESAPEPVTAPTAIPVPSTTVAARTETPTPTAIAATPTAAVPQATAESTAAPTAVAEDQLLVPGPTPTTESVGTDSLAAPLTSSSVEISTDRPGWFVPAVTVALVSVIAICLSMAVRSFRRRDL